jgi:hypothetical protein
MSVENKSVPHQAITTKDVANVVAPLTADDENDLLKFSLADCERTIMEELAAPEATPKGVAQTYALSLKSKERPTVNWAKVNGTIMTRWSLTVLHRIKHCAWNGACFNDPLLNDNLIKHTTTTKKKRKDPLADYKRRKRRRRRQTIPN